MTNRSFAQQTVTNHSPFTTHNSLKSTAFTLAETLITLGIIGVVAAMTIPTLIAKHQERVTVTKLTAAYSILYQATRQMITDEGQTIDQFGDTPRERMDRFEELLPKYVQIIKKCPSLTAGCIARNYKSRFSPNLQPGLNANNGNNMYVLKNGIAIRIAPAGYCHQNMALSVVNFNNPNQHYGTYGYGCGEIEVDINGPAGPNELDVDYFVLKIVKDGIIPSGSSKEGIYTDTFADQCLGKNTGPNAQNSRCAAWVIYNKNMDYLKCDDLAWDGKHRCSD